MTDKTQEFLWGTVIILASIAMIVGFISIIGGEPFWYILGMLFKGFGTVLLFVVGLIGIMVGGFLISESMKK